MDNPVSGLIQLAEDFISRELRWAHEVDLLAESERQYSEDERKEIHVAGRERRVGRLKSVADWREQTQRALLPTPLRASPPPGIPASRQTDRCLSALA